MKSKAVGARIGSAVRPVVEQLENRWLLSALVQTRPLYYPAIAPGAATVPFRDLNPTGTNTGTEQLVASVTGGGVTTVLAQVQDYGDTAQYGDTSLILYARAGTGPWHQQKINTAFDNLSDTDLIGGFTVKKCRKDGQIVMDGQHNVYVMASSDTGPHMRIDRISYTNLQNWLAAPVGTALSIDIQHDVMSIAGSSFRPQLAVGQDPNDVTRTNAYLYYGDPVFGAPAYRLWSWSGHVTDDFSITQWNQPEGDDPNSIGGSWAPMTVGYDGKLYVPQYNQVYTMGVNDTGPSQIFPALPHNILGAESPTSGSGS